MPKKNEKVDAAQAIVNIVIESGYGEIPKDELDGMLSTIQGAQHYNGKWLYPRWGCDSMAEMMDKLYEILHDLNVVKTSTKDKQTEEDV